MSNEDTYISVVPDPKTMLARLKRLSNIISDFSIPNKAAAIKLYGWVQRNFRSEGGKVGGWPRSKAAERRHGQTLQDSGNLRDSFNPIHTKKLAGVFSPTDYSIDHELGLKGLPVRRMLPTEREAWEEVEPIYEKEFLKMFNKVWPR